MELRNFATCMSILDGLENLIVKQLPAWKHLPTKCTTVMEELKATRVSSQTSYSKLAFLLFQATVNLVMICKCVY